MKLLPCLLLLISIKAMIAQPVLEPAERARREEAIAKAADMWRQRFQQIDRGSESSEVIEQLAEVAKAMRHFQDSKAKLNVQPSSDLLTEVQTELVSIPGHAEHYRKKMEDGMTEVANRPNGEKILLSGAFNPIQREIFKSLEAMPSPEAVKVLGDYLSDERGWDSEKGHEIPTDGEGRIDGEALINVQVKNCNMAVRSLARLIENPPESENVYPTVALPAWRLWYNQVKAGNRTYRFKGDPTEYDLNGPVSGAKAPDVKRSDWRAIADSSTEAKEEGERSNNPTIIAIVLAVLIGGGYWIYRRKSVA